MPPPDEEAYRIRERFQLHEPFVLYAGNVKPHKNLERVIEALAQLHANGFDQLKLLIIGNDISKYATLRRAVHRHNLHRLRPLPRLRARPDAGHPLPARVGVRLPVAVRGLRAAAARSHGQRHAGRDVERVVAAGGRRGQRRCWSIRTTATQSRRASRTCCSTRTCATTLRAARASSGRRTFSWETAARALRDDLRRGGPGEGTAVTARAGRPTRPDLDGLRVALVHDWLTGMRGGERVLEALCEIFPPASLFTLCTFQASCRRRSRGTAAIRRSSSGCPRAARWYRHYLPLFPPAVEQFDLDGFDLVISSSHCAVKSVVAPGRARHLCYCHSPMRYAWDQFDAYFGPRRLGSAEPAGPPGAAPLARLGRVDTAHRPHRYLANSQYVAQRIRRYYNRRSAVVPPPVDTEFYTLRTPRQTPTPISWSFRRSCLINVWRSPSRPAVRLGVPLQHRRRGHGAGPARSRSRARAWSFWGV